MKIKNSVSKLLIAFGVLLVLYALFLFVKNEQIEENAKVYNANAVEIIKQEIAMYEYAQEDIFDFNREFSYEDLAKEVITENETYIGILYFPSLDLELAVQSDWSYEKLSNTPCVYQEQPFSIAGHNYSSHFGKLSKLEVGDVVVFTETSGNELIFVVESITIIEETDIEKLQDESYDLTLFTCNYQDNSQRILARLNLS